MKTIFIALEFVFVEIPLNQNYTFDFQFCPTHKLVYNISQKTRNFPQHVVNLCYKRVIGYVKIATCT